MSHRTPMLALAALFLAGPAATAQVSNPPPPVPRPGASASASSDRAMPGGMPRRVIKTDEQWARELTRDQFLVTRRKATEPAFSGKLLHNKAKGVYACACCEAPLFTSRTKFDSGTGWPSFYAPVSPQSVTNEPDHSYGQERVEVVCSTCGAHLGHVFDDGPPPTGLRYCMNSLSLQFFKDSPADARSKARAGKGAGKGAEKADPATPASESKEPAKDTAHR